MNLIATKQNLYIRKLNGFGQKISVEDSITVIQLKQVIGQLKSLQTQKIHEKQFSLIFKGRNISDNAQSTLKQLGIPHDGIIHLVFVADGDKKMESLTFPNYPKQQIAQSNLSISIQGPKYSDIVIKVMFNGMEHNFIVNLGTKVLDLKKRIGSKLNLVFQSLILSHLGSQMLDDKILSAYGVESNTLISVRFNIIKPQKKKLQTRMVSSVTFSDENNQPNKNQQLLQFQYNEKFKLAASSNSFQSDKQQQEQIPKKLTYLLNSNTRPMMYKSDINTFGASQTSKAAMIFKNALHEKIVETQSVVSGSFSEQNSISGNDPNCLMITVKNEQDTKEFIFECQKSHQIINIREKLMEIEKIPNSQKIEISMEQDLFQSIDLNKSGCVTLNEIVKKMGKERAIFIYRIV